MQKVDLDANENALIPDRAPAADRVARRFALIAPKGSRVAVLRSSKSASARSKRPVTLAGSPLPKDVDS